MRRVLFFILALVCSSISYAQAPGSGYSLDFGGTTDYLSVPDNPALNMTSTITLEAWIKADSWSINSWGNVIISKDGWGAGEAGYTLRCGANGTASFMFGTTTSWKEVLSTPQMTLGTWYHLAGTFDGTQLKLYINGMLSGTANYAGPMLASTYALSIGRITYTAGGTRNFDGQIDEVRIWNTALSQTTIQENLTKKVTALHPNYANLVGYWKMDEGTGATSADSGPNNLTGTRNGTTWALSGAAIGDQNAVVYGTPSAVMLTNTDGSSFTAQVNSGNPTGFHIYAVHQTPNTVAENLSGSLETTHYFGTFVVGGTNPSYTATYNYLGVPALTSAPQEQSIRLAYRATNTGTLWSRLNNQFQLDTVSNNVYRCGNVGRREFAAGFDSLRYGITQSSICQGDSLLYFGQYLSTAGLHTHVTTAPNGCDSTVGVQLSLLPTSSGSDSATICSGDSVIFGTQVLTSSGVYNETFASINGCDSVVTFTLTVTPPMSTSITDTICDGEIYTLGSQSITQSGIYSEIFSAVNGCDSLVVLDLAVHVVDTSVSLSGNVLTANLVSPSYQWLACDNGFQPIPSQTNQSFTVGFDGNYAVIVSDGVCSDTSGCHFVLAVGVRAGLDPMLVVYPNPTTAMLKVERRDGGELGWLQLLSVDGKLLVSNDFAGIGIADVNLGGLPRGMYFLKLQIDGRVEIVKVMRE